MYIKKSEMWKVRAKVNPVTIRAPGGMMLKLEKWSSTLKNNIRDLYPEGRATENLSQRTRG